MISSTYNIKWLLVLLAGAGMMHAAELSELINNGSFEQASPLQWEVRLYPRHDAVALPRVFSLTDDLATDGSFTARVDTNEVPAGANLVIISQTHSAYAWRGRRLRLSAQSMLQTERNRDGSPLRLNVRQWGPDNRVVGGTRIDFPNHLGQWSTAMLEFDVEPDALRVDIQLMVMRTDDDLHKTVMLIDNVRLHEALPDALTLSIAGPEASLDAGVLPCRVHVGPHILAATGQLTATIKLTRGDDAAVTMPVTVDRAAQHVALPLNDIAPGPYTIVAELFDADGGLIATDAKDVLLYHGPFAGD